MSEQPDEDETRLRVAEWLRRSATALRSAGDDREAILGVFERFIDEGMALVYSPSALWDHVAAVIRQAGFDAAAWDRRMRIFSTATSRRFRGGRPYPPDWPWHEAE